MSIKRINTKSLPFSNLYKDYLKNEPQLQPFFETAFQDLKKKKPTRDSFINRELLVELVCEFNAVFDLSVLSKENIESLRHKETLTVTTGQQIGLFGGYLYTFFKIITVIKLAKELSEAYQTKVVPIFWIADEDHDFDEANHVHGFKQDFTIDTVQFSRPSNLNQQVAREILPKEMLQYVEEFFESSGFTNYSDELKSWLSHDFAPGKTYKKAFLQFILRLFSPYGLVLFGSDSPQIKKAALPMLEMAVSEAGLLYNLLETQSKRIEEVYHRQAQTDTSMLFLNCKDGRIKLHLDIPTQTWSTDLHQFRTEELLAKLRENPELLSPNVFFRPIIQEYILPNVAYVAGPGEIGYYAQMKTFFDAFGIRMPAIVPRISVTVVEKAFQRYWDEMCVEFHEYLQRIEDLEKTWVESNQPFDIDSHFTKWIDQAHKTAEYYKNDIIHLDSTLGQSLDRAVTIYANELDKLKSKTARALKHKEETRLSRLRKIQSSVFPANTLQERKIGFIYFLNKYGPDCFQELFSDDVSAIEAEHIVLFI